MNTTNIKRAKGRPRKLDKNQGLLGALGLFQRYGFDNVSVAQLCTLLKVPATSLYASYGNKESLFLSAFDLYCQQFFDALNSALNEAENASQMFRNTLESVLEFYAGFERNSACLILQGGTFCKQQRVTEQVMVQQQKLADLLQQRLEQLGSENAAELTDVLLTLLRGFSLSVQSETDEEKRYTTLEFFCSAFDC